MKLSKQTGQVLVLAILMLGLVGYGAYTIMGANKSQTVAPKPKAASEKVAGEEPKNGSKQNAKAPVAAKAIVSWLQQDRVAQIVKTAKGGRNPFQDIIIAGLPDGNDRLVTFKKPIDEPTPTPPTPEGTLELQTMTVTLQWITPREIAAKMQEQGLAVKVSIGKNGPHSVTIEGENPDFEMAMTLIEKLNAPPPPPPFMLTGVMLTPGTRYAAINANGNVYTVLEGEAVPTTDWIVTHISPSTVTLKKGKQSVSLRLTGGSPS